MKKLEEYLDLYLNDALNNYQYFKDNTIRDLFLEADEDYFEIVIIDDNQKFVSFYMNDKSDDLIVTTNVFNCYEESYIRDNAYYSDNKCITDISAYHFIELFKYNSFLEVFNIVKNADN